MTVRRMRWTALVMGMTLWPVVGHGAESWRFWTAADGMMESFSRAVNRGIDGEIWVRHGTVAKMSILDGRGVRQIADPWKEAGDPLARQRRVWPDESGGAWAIENLALMRFEGDRWKVEWQGDRREEPLEMARFGSGRLVVLFEGRVALYEIAKQKWSTLMDARRGEIGSYREIAAGFGGEVWIAGTEGFGRLQGNGEWMEWNSREVGLRDLDHLHAGKGGEIFVSGEMKSGKGRGTALWRNGKLALVAQDLGGEGFGWRGPEDSIWLLDGRKIFRIDGESKVEVARRGRLASEIFSVVTEPDGGFWLGTVDGLVHQKPGLWRTPAGVADVRSIVHDIIEDRRGRLWFAASEYLVKLEGEQWKKYEMPRRMPTHNLMSRALAELADGRLMVKSKDQANPDRILLFEASNGSFTELKMPGGRTMQFFRGRRNGRVLVGSAPGLRLDEFDGEKFRIVADLTGKWHGGTLKDLEEAADGKIWLAGAAGGGVLEGGKYKEFPAEENAGESGFFSLVPNKSGGMRLGGRKSLMAYNKGHLTVRRAGLDRVRSMSYDRTGALWMATAAGMERIEQGRWMRNGEADGLNSDMVHKVFEDSKGRLWAGTTHGISCYHGESDREAPQTRLQLSQIPKQASPGGVIRMAFAGLDKWKQTESEHLLYSYRLDGGDWSVYAEGAAASFEGLSPGDHRLEMRAMDRNGNAEETPDLIRFGVPVPWYREGGFFVVAVIGGVSILGLFVVAVMIFRQRGALVEELEKSRASAEATSRQKSIFLANMSHEIRTPMNAILGMSELALHTRAGAEQEEYLKLVTSSATELLNLLNDILDLSKVEAGKLELVEGNFDLHGCVEGVVRTLEQKAREKGLEIQIRIAAGTRRYVVGDEHRLRQILFNLVGNGLKFSEHGEVEIEVEEAEGDAMAFVVRDEGEGIEIEQQGRIFEAFVQADGSATRKHGGTGLGLAITTELVKKMGGSIRVESPWRKDSTGPEVAGSAMHFTINLKRGSEPDSVPVMELREKTAPMRVLVAEDNLVNQKLIDHLLRRDGHAVTLVGNGQEAIDALKSLSVDLVLMDVQMPELDGLEATRLIREAEIGSGEHLMIVAITANALDGDREKCMEAGMDDYLTKPLRLAELRRVLHSRSSVS